MERFDIPVKGPGAGARGTSRAGKYKFSAFLRILDFSLDLHLTYTYIMNSMGITPKQKRVYDFIRGYIETYGFSPSYDEIRNHLGLRSYYSVQKYLRQLEAKEMIRTPWSNRKRAIELVDKPGTTVKIPLLGTVAAGSPIEPVQVKEDIEVPEGFLDRKDHFVLRVKGDSMIDEGINDGDLVVVRKQKVAQNGQAVVALVDGEVTIKRFFLRGERVELRPGNENIEPIIVGADQVEIEGVVVALMRRY